MSPVQTEVSWGLGNGEGKRSSETPSCMPDEFRLEWQRVLHSAGGNNQGTQASQQKGKNHLCDVTRNTRYYTIGAGRGISNAPGAASPSSLTIHGVLITGRCVFKVIVPPLCRRRAKGTIVPGN